MCYLELRKLNHFILLHIIHKLRANMASNESHIRNIVHNTPDMMLPFHREQLLYHTT